MVSPCWAAKLYHIALSLLFLKGKERENMTKRTQGSRLVQRDCQLPSEAKQNQCRENSIIYCLLQTGAVRNYKQKKTPSSQPPSSTSFLLSSRYREQEMGLQSAITLHLYQYFGSLFAPAPPAVPPMGCCPSQADPT